MAPPGSKSQVPKPTLMKNQSSAKSVDNCPTTCKGSSASAAKSKKPFELPALSISYVPKVTDSELEKLKKKTIRRNAPPGEDLRALKTILQTIKGQTVTVQEFIGLVAPSTGDKGEAFRHVMNDDLVAFRKLARKVYDTITQDNSDVLLNQQMQLNEYYREKKTILNNKMMNIIEEIYTMVPNFDFERYNSEKLAYLEEVLPIPDELKLEPEEMEMMKRQAAYHRLQWLRSEGERLNEENNSLKRRLNQLKRVHMQEQKKMVQMEKHAEAQKEALEEEEAEKKETLEMLNRSLEKTIIEREKSIRVSKDAKILEPKPRTASSKKKSSTNLKKVRSKSKWNEVAASQIEGRMIEENKQNELSKVSPFHSPSRRPPTSGETSPFHYSPPKPPEGGYYGPPERTSPICPASSQQVPQNLPTQGRRAQGPRDTWGGFY